jgi:hypothetical protein
MPSYGDELELEELANHPTVKPIVELIATRATATGKLIEEKCSHRCGVPEGEKAIVQGEKASVYKTHYNK